MRRHAGSVQLCETAAVRQGDRSGGTGGVPDPDLHHFAVAADRRHSACGSRKAARRPRRDGIAADHHHRGYHHAADLQRLELNDNMVLSIRRLRYVDGIPLTIEEMRFSREYLYLLMEDLTGSIHSLLQEHGVKLKAAQKSFAICNATKEEAELLNVERGSALLFMKNMFYDQNKKPVFFSKDVFNADYFELKFTLQDND